jgi:DNA invertase Pin-like site-specific DNA recombinase
LRPRAMLTVMIVVFARGKDANALWEYARMREWDEHDDITATSQIEELLRLAGMGKVSIVLMSSLIGVARTVPGVLAAVREFIERGIRLVILNAKVDTSAMPRQRMLKFLDTLGEFHHAVAVENIHEGLERARKAGVKLGRPHSVNPHHDDVMVLRKQGLSGYAIAEALGIPSSTVFKILRCPA